MSKGHSIVALEQFIQATRDSGYRGTTSTVAELVDNSLEAGASKVSIDTGPSVEVDFLELIVRDDGIGMSRSTLRQALRFGGSSRFANRSGLGRYGMGLPNASLNQSRRVSVYTWKQPDVVWMTYLDIDEIAEGATEDVPVPRRVKASAVPGGSPSSKSGTVVHWGRCDRLDNRRPGTIHRKLKVGLGRAFRHFIWKGAVILVDGDSVVPIDPLFVRADSLTTGGVLEREWSCEVRDTMDPASPVGVVSVRFSSLPVLTWSRWSKAEKRQRGITNGAGVSIVRGGREVDYGWFFMGGKRRQNYDDWWRCEISFEPVLDEAFGITHTKQQIRPAVHLKEALTPFIEQAARELHGRVRAVQAGESNQRRVHQSEHDANRRVVLGGGDPDHAVVRPVVDKHGVLAEVNPAHPMMTSLKAKEGPIVNRIFLAAVRAESAASASDVAAVRRFRERWSAELAALSNGSLSG
jgi:hypothetical protein